MLQNYQNILTNDQPMNITEFCYYKCLKQSINFFLLKFIGSVFPVEVVFSRRILVNQIKRLNNSLNMRLPLRIILESILPMPFYSTNIHILQGKQIK